MGTGTPAGGNKVGGEQEGRKPTLPPPPPLVDWNRTPGTLGSRTTVLNNAQARGSDKWGVYAPPPTQPLNTVPSPRKGRGEGLPAHTKYHEGNGRHLWSRRRSARSGKDPGQTCADRWLFPNDVGKFFGACEKPARQRYPPPPAIPEGGRGVGR